MAKILHDTNNINNNDEEKNNNNYMMSTYHKTYSGAFYKAKPANQ